jgi:hypothetical protein
MKTVVIDPGHGGTDPGGQSLGAPEKEIALTYATQLTTLLRARGHLAVLTRETDVFVPLPARARIANELPADLFVSVHANASGNPAARGPWTIHAASSERGREVATSLQRAMVSVFGGSRGSVHPDASGWTGDRRLAVLRQTKMPAVLLELGFMTNAADIAQMTDPEKTAEACAALAAAIHAELGGDQVPEIPRVEPSVTPSQPVPPPIIDRIYIPRREHVDELVRVRGIPADALRPGLALAEALLRRVAAGQSVDVKREIVKAGADALSEWLRDQAA